MAVEIINTPKIDVKCSHCKTEFHADHEHFLYRHTNPPLWKIDCPVCKMTLTVAPSELIAAHVGMMFDERPEQFKAEMDSFIEKRSGQKSVWSNSRFVTPHPEQYDCYGRPITNEGRLV